MWMLPAPRVPAPPRRRRRRAGRRPRSGPGASTRSRRASVRGFACPRRFRSLMNPLHRPLCVSSAHDSAQGCPLAMTAPPCTETGRAFAHAMTENGPTGFRVGASGRRLIACRGDHIGIVYQIPMTSSCLSTSTFAQYLPGRRRWQRRLRMRAASCAPMSAMRSSSTRYTSHVWPVRANSRGGWIPVAALGSPGSGVVFRCWMVTDS